MPSLFIWLSLLRIKPRIYPSGFLFFCKGSIPHLGRSDGTGEKGEGIRAIVGCFGGIFKSYPGLWNKSLGQAKQIPLLSMYPTIGKNSLNVLFSLTTLSHTHVHTHKQQNNFILALWKRCWGIPDCVQGLFLTLCSGILLEIGAQRSIHGPGIKPRLAVCQVSNYFLTSL